MSDFKSFLNNHASRGMRNNNPGNLVRTATAWKGKIPYSQSQDNHFEQFTDIHWGIRALMVNLRTQQNKYKLNTVAKQITKYAPPTENNTAQYINFVAEKMGVTPHAVIDVNNQATMLKMAKAIVLMEVGQSAYNQLEAVDFETAYNRISGNVEEVSAVQKTCKYCGHVIAVLALFFFTYSAITM